MLQTLCVYVFLMLDIQLKDATQVCLCRFMWLKPYLANALHDLLEARVSRQLPVEGYGPQEGANQSCIVAKSFSCSQSYSNFGFLLLLLEHVVT